MTAGIEGIGKSVLNDPRNIEALKAAGVSDKALPIDRTKQYPADAKSEKELQSQCEGWLMLRDYRRLTAEHAMKGGYVRGWFGHRPAGKRNNKRNPFMPDLAIFAAGGKCLLVELKHPPIKYEDGQEAMISRGIWKLATTLDEFIALVKAWEEGSAE